MKIDNEFSGLIPPISNDEKALLEESLVKEGCRDKLCVWNDLLVDGHNRHEICERRGIDYEVKEMDFESREDAKIWIINNQFGRRNITSFTRAELALKLKPLIAEKAKENLSKNTKGGDGFPMLGNNPHLWDGFPMLGKVNTEKEIAEKAQVSHGNIYKVGLV